MYKLRIAPSITFNSAVWNRTDIFRCESVLSPHVFSSATVEVIGSVLYLMKRRAGKLRVYERLRVAFRSLAHMIQFYYRSNWQAASRSNQLRWSGKKAT